MKISTKLGKTVVGAWLNYTEKADVHIYVDPTNGAVIGHNENYSKLDKGTPLALSLHDGKAFLQKVENGETIITELPLSEVKEKIIAFLKSL